MRYGLDKEARFERAKAVLDRVYRAPGRWFGRNVATAVDEGVGAARQQAKQTVDELSQQARKTIDDLGQQAQKTMGDVSGKAQQEAKAFSELGKQEAVRHLVALSKQVAPGMAAGAAAGAAGGATHGDSRLGAGRGMLMGALGGLGGRAFGPGMGRSAIGGALGGAPAGAFFGKDKSKVVTSSVKNKYAGVTLDWYDDKGATLREKFPTVDRLPQVIKEANIRPKEKLAHDDFALVAIDEGNVMRKFACHDPGTTAMSVIYFMEHGDKLPESAQKLAAANLVEACRRHEFTPPEALEKVALGVLPLAATGIGAGTGALAAGEGRRLQGALAGGALGAAGGLLGFGAGASWRSRKGLADAIRRGTLPDMDALGQAVLRSGVAGTGVGAAGGGALGGLGARYIRLRGPEEREKAAAVPPELAKRLMGAGLGAGIGGVGAGLEGNPNTRAGRILTGAGTGMLGGILGSGLGGSVTGPLAGAALGGTLGSVGGRSSGFVTQRQLDKVFGGKEKGGSSNVVDITGQRPTPKVKVARSESNDDYAVVLPDGSRHYPIGSWDLMKKAEVYYGEESIRMQPEIRRQFATKLAAKARATGYPLSSEILEAGSTTYAAPGHLKAAVEMRKIACSPGQPREWLDELFEKRAHLGPGTYAECLRRFDVEQGLDKGWDRVVLDPWASTFGINKTAEVVWESGAERVTDEALHELAVNFADDLKDQFTEDFVNEFQKDPVALFNSMPDPQKKILARMANDSASYGASEQWATRSPTGRLEGHKKAL